MKEVSPFVQKLYRFIEIAERVFLAVSIIAVSLKLLKISSNEFLILSLGTLSTLHFILSKRTAESVLTENPFIDLGIFIRKKIMPTGGWISCSVAIVGILFTLMNWDGAIEMLFLGWVCTLIFSLGLGYDSWKGDAQAKKIVMRAVPLMLISLYLYTATSNH